jgi:glycosyltransferase involved in cell wall biosynthesis
MTSVHRWDDVRIFQKMCRSLAQAGHEVHLVAPRDDTQTDEEHDGVTVHAVPRRAGRLGRMLWTVRDVARTAASTDADLYHFHDPEFLMAGARLQRQTDRPVVYDVHEDYRLRMTDKAWLPRRARRLAGAAFGRLEDWSARRLAGIVAATDPIAKRFVGHPHSVTVCNFPMLDEFGLDPGDPASRTRGLFVYAGAALTRGRGIREMIQALPLAGRRARLALAGIWRADGFRTECRQLDGWKQVAEYGYLGRDSLRQLLRSAQAGLELAHPEPGYMASYPVKVFEYMAAGLPVILSDFPIWREAIGGGRCGLSVDPREPRAIARAMRRVISDPEWAARLGGRGRERAFRAFNWAAEFDKLQEFYARLVEQDTNNSRSEAYLETGR